MMHFDTKNDDLMWNSSWDMLIYLILAAILAAILNIFIRNVIIFSVLYIHSIPCLKWCILTPKWWHYVK